MPRIHCPKCSQNTVERVTGTDTRICTMCAHQWQPTPAPDLRRAYRKCYGEIRNEEVYNNGISSKKLLELRKSYGDTALWAAMESAAHRYDWPDTSPTRMRHSPIPF